MAWAIFLASAGVIIVAGSKLAWYGDEIAERSGLGRLWVGVVFLAMATSLPEVFTTVSAALLDTPDLAAGDLFGACMSNMLTLGLIDLLHRGKRVWQQAAFEHTLTAALAMALTGLAALLILVKEKVTFGAVGLGSVTLLSLYVLGMRLVYRQEDMKRHQQEQERMVEGHRAATVSSRVLLRGSVIRFCLAASILLIAAPLLAWSANQIAEQTGISTTFVGTSLVAVTTSLPELVSAIAAVRLGAFDLAVGNLFGSNAFNMAAFLFVDVAYREGPVLNAVNSSHALTALWSILMMNFGLMGIIYRAEKRFLFIEPDSLLMILSYGLGLWLVFG
jgi:cation:H+ antiporter